MRYLKVGQPILVDVPLGFDWPWARRIKMVVTSNSPHQNKFPIESSLTWIRATPAEDVLEVRELDVQVSWIKDLDSVSSDE